MGHPPQIIVSPQFEQSLFCITASEEPELVAIARWQRDNGKPLPKRLVFISWQN